VNADPRNSRSAAEGDNRASPPEERHDLMGAYHRLLTGTDEKARLQAAVAWSQWEGRTITLLPDAGGGTEGNVGKILEPVEAQIKFLGNKTGDVVAMPTALRIITGDAKAFINGNANANANWSCTGFENKVQLEDKYPICPEGSDVVRTTLFQSCWDGQNIDSANHRTHVAFVQADGTCANGFKAIPQLRVRLVYDVPAPTIENGQVVNPFAVDSFPENLHKPITDHNDFINFFDTNTMNKVVSCINTGKKCT